MSAIDKTIKRVYQRIQRSEFYEAHQAARTVVARLARQKDHAGAISLLYTSSLLLARANQTGSAADLLIYMLSEYTTAGVKVDSTSRGRVSQVLWQLDPRDSVLKQVAKQTTDWAHKSGSAPPTGDPELNHVFGVQFARANLPYDAEKYLLLGTRASAEILADIHRQWYLLAPQQADFRELYISRGFLGYLTTQNLRNAKVYLERSVKGCQEDGFKATTVEGVATFDDLRWINFFQLLLKVCQTKQAVLYRKLAARYDPKEYATWNPAFKVIEESYFGIAPPKAMNIADLMGGLFK